MKKTAILLIMSILLGILAGCSSDKEIILRDHLDEKVESLDPANAVKDSEKLVIEAIFEGLCRLNAEGEAVPGAAAEWETNADNTQFTFHLRKNVKWSDQTPLVAEDFVFGIQRALAPETGSTLLEDLYIIKNAAAVHRGEMDAQQLGVYAQDERTLVIQLEKSYPEFPKLTAGTRYMPTRREFFEQTQGRYGLSAETTLTNGPFTFRNIYAWESGAHIQLAKMRYYIGEHAAAATDLIFTMNDTTVTADPSQALLNGLTDVLQVSAVQAEALGQQGAQVTTIENAVFGLLMNGEAENLQDNILREMLMKTIRRGDLLARLDEEQEEAAGIVPKSVMWNGMPYAETAEVVSIDYDNSVLENLPSLLSQKEWETVPSITILCREDDASREVANGLVVSWNEQFLTSFFNLEAVDDETFDSRVQSGNYEAALVTLSASGNTPNAFFRRFKSDAAISLMENAELDAMMNGLLFDRERYRVLEMLIRDEYIFYPICYTDSYYATAPQSRNIRIRADGGIDFTKATKKE